MLSAALLAAAAFSSAGPALSSDGLAPDAIFSKAKLVWRARADAPFVHFALRERYVWRSRTHDNWWQVSFRRDDRAIALQRQVVAEQEAARLHGTPITLNLRFHTGLAKADSVDTNPDADAFPILDPQIEPDASFGLVRAASKAALVGNVPATPAGSASSSPPAAPEAAPSSAESPLRVLATVEAASRDYRIELAGIESVRDADTYHLLLTPLGDPHVYRLRDLWIDTKSFETVQMGLAGLFEGEPYASARWIVSYVDIDGHSYIQQVRTDDRLRFGMDRFVSGLQFDFVQYEFPPTIPEMTFERYL